jgi:hypothetical protein
MKAPKADPKRPGIDRQDVLFVVGLISFLSGIGLWSIPAALVALGILCFAAVLMIQRAKSLVNAKDTDGSAHQ